jgi:hypothetical protein
MNILNTILNGKYDRQVNDVNINTHSLELKRICNKLSIQPIDVKRLIHDLEKALGKDYSLDDVFTDDIIRDGDNVSIWDGEVVFTLKGYAPPISEMGL